MKLKSNIIISTTIVIAAWAALTSAAAPPNPTKSDANGNTAGGTGVLTQGIGGIDNTAFGYSALVNNLGSGNNAFGSMALTSNSGSRNNAFGGYSLYGNADGSDNSAFGQAALLHNFSGYENTAIGSFALLNNYSGYQNLGLGARAGSNLTSGNNNIYLKHPGASIESNTIRIGLGSTRTFIAGIRGRTVATNAIPVVIDSNGRLGTIVSSARFKKDIENMAASSNKLMQLRPVTYHYKQADESGANPLEYGLIAEEVAKVYPDLVVYGADGKIETVQYHKLTPMLLNEVQRMNRSLDADNLKISKQDAQLTSAHQLIQQQAQEIAGLKQQADKVASLEQQITALKTQGQAIAALTSRLSRMEANQSVGLLEAGARLSN